MSNFLIHYASPYYDPVKTHEYYMRTRELKGRSSTRSTSALSDEGKEIWKVTKEGIATEKKAEVAERKDEQDTEISSARSIAKEHKEVITAKLKELNEALSLRIKNDQAKLKSDDERRKTQISDTANSQIEKLYEAEPGEGLSEEEKAKWKEERAEKVEKLRSRRDSQTSDIDNTYSTRYKAIKTEGANERTSNNASAKQERQQVATELKGAVATARETYKSKKEEITNRYEDVYQQEYDAIKAQYPKITKSKKSSSKSSSSSSSSNSTISAYKKAKGLS